MALNFPDTPTNGQKFIAANGVEYTYNSANDSWTGALEAGTVPIDPSPSDVSVTPAFGNPSGTNPGTGTSSDPYIITTETVLQAGSTSNSDQYITVTKGKPGDQVLFTNNTTPTAIAPKFNQAVGIIDANGQWSGYLTYDDTVGTATTTDSTYTGKLQLGTSSVYFQWAVQQGAATPIAIGTNSVVTSNTQPTITPTGNALVASEPVPTGGTAPYTYAYRWEESSDDATYTPLADTVAFKTNTLVLSNTSTSPGKYYRCKVTISDSGSFSTQTIDSLSNGINVVNITVSLDDTTPEVGDVVTASSTITGNNTNYVESDYQWYRTDTSTAIAGATSKSYTVVSADVGLTLACEVSASSSVDDQATISNTSEFTSAVVEPESVNTPTLLTPPNGAGLISGYGIVLPTTSSNSTVTTVGTVTTAVASGNKDITSFIEGTISMTDATGNVVNYTPKSSAITAVTAPNNYSYSTQPVTGTPYSSDLTWAAAFTGPQDTNGAVSSDYSLTSINLTQTPITVPSGSTLKIYVLNNALDTQLQLNGSTLSTLGGFTKTASDNAAATYFFSKTFSSSFNITSCGVEGQVRWLWMEIDDVPIVNGWDKNTVLSLTNNQDLIYFQTGDRVQTGVKVVSVSTTTTPPTMTVDGGSWAVAGVVTGVASTGTGNIPVGGINTGTNTITINDSNKRWISSGAWNTVTQQGNAAGTSFYLTGAESQEDAVDPNDLVMTCTPFAGVGGPVYGTTTWQITTDADTSFSNPVVNVTNTDETSFTVTGTELVTSTITTVTGAGTTVNPYVLTFTTNSKLSEISVGDYVYSRTGSDIFSGNVTAVDTTAKTLTITSTSAWAGAVGAVVVGDVQNALEGDTIYRARVRQTSTNAVQSDFSLVNRFKTSGSDSGDVPNADMSGLRFDSARETSLSRTLGNPTQFTFSVWYKFTGSGFGALLATTNDGNNYISIDTTNNRVNYRTSSGLATFACTPATNRWQHLVLSFNSSNSQVSLWLDGELQERQSGSALAGSDFYVGKVESNSFDGYLSEVYFVDGFAKPPETFGKYFPEGSNASDGVWGPLNSTVIEAAIGTGPIQPYDTRANTSEVWSSKFTGPPQGFTTTNPLTFGFDGNKTTFANADSNGGVGTLNVGFGSGTFDVEIDALNSIPGIITIDGVEATSQSSSVFFWKGLTTLNNIVWTTTNSRVCFKYVMINGRILVNQDLWNIAENWVGSSTFFPAMLRDIDLAFDGSTSTNASSTQANPSSMGVTFPSPITSVNSLYIYSNSNNAVVSLDGNTGSTVAVTPNQWTEVTSLVTSNTVSSIAIDSTSDNSTLAAVKVNGAILVNEAAQWNTSQIWSNQKTGGPGTNNTNAFDGNSTTSNLVASSNNDSNLVWTLAGFTAGQSVKIKTDGAANSGNIICNGTTIITNQGNAPVITDCGVLAGTTLTITQEITPDQSTSDGNKIFYVEVDGKLLVDKSNFGANGFYLPFDPSNTSEDYSSNVSSLGEVNSSVNAFDGSNSNRWSVNCDSTSNFLSVTFDPPLVGQLSVLEYSSNQSTFQYAVNGSDVGSPHTGFNGLTETDLGTYGSITEFKYKVASTSSAQQGGFTGLKLNGVLLVDHNSIGVDASGKNNDFYDQNFGVGNTSQVWSAAPSSNIVQGTLPAFFDGSTDTGCDTTGAGVTGSLDVSSWGFSNCKVEIYATDSGDTTITVNGNNVPGQDDSQRRWQEITVTGALSTITWVASSGPYTLRAIKVDGVVLVDTNQQDTVTDTPLMNYAVLTSNSTFTGSNGNLAITMVGSGGYSPSSVSLDPTKSYYFETTVSKDINSGAGITNNADQTNPGTGNFTGKYGIFSTSSGSYSSVNNTTVTGISAAAAVGDLLGIAVNLSTKSMQCYVNGVLAADFTMTGTNDSVGYQFVGISGNQANNKLVSNFGQQPFAASNVTYDQATGIATLNNIKQPYDYRANTSQVWSAGGSITGSLQPNTTLAQLFDGSTSTGPEPAAGSTAEYTLPGAPYTGSLELYITTGINDGQPNEQYDIKLDDVSIFADIPVPNNTQALVDCGERTFSKISFGSAGSQWLRIGQVKLDGRILVDTGVWNVSQNWSADGDDSTTVAGYPWSAAFDGNTSSANPGNTGVITSGESICVLPTPLSGAFKFAFSYGSEAGGSDVTLAILNSSGTEIDTFTTGDGYSSNVLWSVTASDVASLKIKNGSGMLRYVELDGAILVDSGAQWNTSRVWSDTVTTNVPLTRENLSTLFNGNTTQECGLVGAVGNDTTGLVLTFPAISNVTSIKVGSYHNTAGASLYNTYQVNGLTPVSSQNVGSPWNLDLYSGAAITLNSITVKSTTEVTSCSLFYIEVNGKILVDTTVGTYRTLFETFEQQESVSSGIIYYNENTGRSIDQVELGSKYGLYNRADPTRGIYALTEQPTYPVSHFIKSGTNYRPVRSYSGLALNLYNTIKSVATEWVASGTYVVNNFVTNGDNLYRATVDHNSSAAFSTDASNWTLVDLTFGGFNGIEAPPNSLTSTSTSSSAYSSDPNTFTVTVLSYYGSNAFYVDGVKQGTISLTEGQTYKFDQSASSNTGHPLKFSTVAHGVHASGSEYTTGVTYVGTPGSAGAYTQIVVASGAPTLYYYCVNHTGMGGTALTVQKWQH